MLKFISMFVDHPVHQKFEVHERNAVCLNKYGNEQ